MALSNESIETLHRRGIELDRDSHGPVITLSTKGVTWLLNHKDASGIPGPLELSQDVLQAIAYTAPEAYRTLVVRQIPMPVKEHWEYLSFCFYLECTPPRQINLFHTLYQRGGFDGRIEVTPGLFKSFGPVDDQAIAVLFSAVEQAALAAGEVVRVAVDT